MILSTLFSDPVFFVLWVCAIVYGITIHEFSHVAMARALGDKTGEEHGRLTLNPLAHIDAMGFLLLLIAGFGWGRPARPVVGRRFGFRQRRCRLKPGCHRRTSAGQHLVVVDIEQPQPALLA